MSQHAFEISADPTLADLLERPGSHLHEVTALDRLCTVLRTMRPGSLALLYGAAAADADAVAETAVELYLGARREAMLADPRIHPVVLVDAPFDAAGGLDLRFLFTDVMAAIGAPPASVQVPRGRTADSAMWARGRRQQLRETADFHLGAVAACRGRDVEVVVIRHLERSGRRVEPKVRGAGTETLVQFAAAAGVVLVLAGGYEVLDHRTTATGVEEVHVRRYDPGVAADVAEFARVAVGALQDVGHIDVVGDVELVPYLMAQTLGSVAVLRDWVERARSLRAARGDAYHPLTSLEETEPAALHQLSAAALRIRTAEARLAEEARVTVDDVLALLTGIRPNLPEPGPIAPTRKVKRRHPDGLRPGERGLIDDPVGVADAHAA